MTTAAETPAMATDRVTPAMLEAMIAGQYFLNPRASALPADVPDWQREALGVLTLCILVLRNGWVVVGKSACVSPELFDAEVGNRLAREDAVRQMWPLEGYMLKTFRHLEDALHEDLAAALAAKVAKA